MEEMIFFYSIHVESNLPKIVRQGTPPPRIEMLEPIQMETQIAGTCMVEDDFFL